MGSSANACGRGVWLPGTDENANYEHAIPLLPGTQKPAQMRKRDRERAEARHISGRSRTVAQRASGIAGTRTRRRPNAGIDEYWRATVLSYPYVQRRPSR